MAAAACAYWALSHVDEALRAAIEDRFQSHYTDLSVFVQSARRIEGRGIEIRGLSIVRPDGDIEDAQLLYCEEVFIHCQARLTDLASGDLKPSRILIRRPTLRATKQADGAWSVSQLLPPPRFGDRRPVIEIEQGELEINDPSRDCPSPCKLRQIRLVLKPANDPETGAELLQAEGSMAGNHFQSVDLRATVDVAHGRWAAAGSVKRLEVSPRLLASLPLALGSKTWLPDNFYGLAEASFEASNVADETAALPFRVWGVVSDGRIEDRRLPHAITTLRGEFAADNRHWRIENVSARSGDAPLKFAARRDGYEEASPWSLRLIADEFVVGRKMESFLPAQFRPAWSKFRPSGVFDVDVSLQWSHGKLTPQATVHARDASFVYDKFPYPLAATVGTIVLDDQSLRAQLRAVASGRPVNIHAEIDCPGPEWTGGIDVSSEGTLPINQRMLDALPEKPREIVNRFNAQGEVSVTARFERAAPQAPLQKNATVTFHDCSVRYEKFPYPIDRINGKMVWEGGTFSFPDLKGRNDNCMIECRGEWAALEKGRGELNLTFDATDVSLEDELRGALGEGPRKMWDSLRPRGTFDSLRAIVGFTTPERQLSLAIELEQLPRERESKGRGVSLEPSWFPYRMEGVTGKLSYRNGHVDFRGLRAHHGGVMVSLEGTGDVFQDGRWRANLQKLNVDHLRCDPEFIRALPPRLARAAGQLKPTGPLMVFGNLQLAGDRSIPGTTSVEWNLTVDMENGTLKLQTPVEHIHGGVKLRGSADSQGMTCEGKLAIDSAIFQGVQFTQVAGPIWIDSKRALFGAWAERKDAPDKRRMTAKVFDGDIICDAQITFDGPPAFALTASLNNASLRRISTELLPPGRLMTGLAHGSLRLSGLTQTRHSWRGAGAIQLRQADIYELPVMVALLKLLSIRPPDTTAFAAGDMKFGIQDNYIYFNELDFHGDAVSLKGRGEMDWQRQIKLHFYTEVGREGNRLPFFSLLGEASRQLMLIHVTGTLDDPQVEREAFPGLNETLQQMFPAPGAAPQGVRPGFPLPPALNGGPVSLPGAM